MQTHSKISNKKEVIGMAGRNGTGPQGDGPGTGKRKGRCKPDQSNRSQNNKKQGKNGGKGKGRGKGGEQKLNQGIGRP